MRIRDKIIGFFIIVGLLPILIYMFLFFNWIHNKHFKHEYDFYIGQLIQINSNINTLFSTIGKNVEFLSINKIVKEREDTDFTNFLNADEKTFKYNIGPKEKEIMDIFNLYLKTHPEINSVYMGRENGSFVRSHPRPRPTKYDPRQRPWYIQAKQNPHKVVITKPYKSVTSDDVNIGVVKALVDEHNNFYGVVGADITLDRLSDFITNIKLLKADYIFIVNDENNILVHPDKKLLFKKINELNLAGIENIYKKQQGYFKFKTNVKNNYLFYYTDADKGWKICIVVDEGFIIKELSELKILIIAGLVFIIFVVFFTSYFFTGRLYNLIKILIQQMSDLVEKIKNNSVIEKIQLKTNDELQQLADGFDEMAVELKIAYDKLNDDYKRITELDKLKSAFISMVSHELRTPLTIIKGSVALLKKENLYEYNPKRAELIEMMYNNINRLQSIIEDLLDLSKIETGVFPVKKKKGNVIEVLDKTIEELLPSFTGKNIKIIKKYDEKPLIWNFDNLRIIRVFNALLTNAVKFSFDNSEVKVDIKVVKGKDVELPIYLESFIYLKKDYLLFSVSDTGIGIEIDYLEKIFEKLFQIENPLIRKYQGAGIGLSIAKGIVDAHDGFIWCESEGINKGTTFYVLLPE